MSHATVTRARARAAIWTRRLLVALTLVIWAGVLAVSFENLSSAAAVAFPQPFNYVFAACLDAFIVVAGLSVLQATLERRSTRFGWTGTVLAVAASAALNVSHSDSANAAVFMAAAPICQAWAWEYLMRSVRSTLTPTAVPARPRKDRDTSAATAAPLTPSVPVVVPAAAPARPRQSSALAAGGGKRAEIEQVIRRWQAEGRDPFVRGVAPQIARETGAADRYVRSILDDLAAARDAGDTASGPATVAPVRAVA